MDLLLLGIQLLNELLAFLGLANIAGDCVDSHIMPLGNIYMILLLNEHFMAYLDDLLRLGRFTICLTTNTYGSLGRLEVFITACQSMLVKVTSLHSADKVIDPVNNFLVIILQENLRILNTLRSQLPLFLSKLRQLLAILQKLLL